MPYADFLGKFSGSPYLAGAPSHNGITVGCWVSSGHIPPPALDKRPIIHFVKGEIIFAQFIIVILQCLETICQTFFKKKLRKASLGENERLRGETALIRGATPPGWGESSTQSGETFPILGERVRNKRTRTVKK